MKPFLELLSRTKLVNQPWVNDVLRALDADGLAQYNVFEAKTHLSRLLERVSTGEHIVIARAGVPVAKLVPYHAREPRVPGVVSARILMDARVPRGRL